ncbi:MAG: 30S ribosomal protein S2 [Anderseniella sp.]|nr:30S ribosomal protein S2 [Anderseniella sp.]
MALPDYSMRQLLEAGVHFGHQTHRWNPKMGSYIYGARNGIHVMDLSQTVPLLHQALLAVRDTVAGGGRLLFVGTKRQAQEQIADAARRSAQYFINSRWLGGTMTNWKTISNSIKRLRELEELFDGGAQGFTKREQLTLTRERNKLELALGGIKDMGGVPNILFVIDTNKEAIAIKEANRLGIPVIAVLDSNSDPAGIDFPIPGNDDAGRAIALYCDLVARAAIDGISESAAGAGIDLGAAEEPAAELAIAEPAPAAEPAPVEAAPAEAAPAEAAPAAETAPAAEAAPAAGDADDLSRISGVGPVLSGKLAELGYTTLSQIAALTPEQVADIDEKLNFKGRIEREDWIGQAKGMIAG